MSRPWDGVISAEEIERYQAAGFGRPTGMGKRPALLIIDVQYRTVGLERRPYWEAIEEFKTSCGSLQTAAFGIDRHGRGAKQVMDGRGVRAARHGRA